MALYSDDPRELTPNCYAKWLLFDAKMRIAKLPYKVTCTSRQDIVQNALYAQGREELDVVNDLRHKCFLTPITAEENKKKVTWTLKSEHITSKTKPKSRAFDIVILKGKAAMWDIKGDVNENNIADYDEAGAIGKSVGLTWGGDWSSPDKPHFQYTE